MIYRIIQTGLKGILLLAWLVTVQVEPVSAQADRVGVPWNELSAKEREVLEPFADTWEQLPPDRQARLRKGAGRWANMNAEERGVAKQRFQGWRQLPPDQRDRIRRRFERFQQLSPEERRALRKARRQFRGLPPEQRRQLREKWRGMTPEQRRKFLRKRGIDRPQRQLQPRGDRHPRARRFRR